MIFSDDRIKESETLVRILKTHLLFNDFNYCFPPESNKILYGLGFLFFNDESDKNYATEGLLYARNSSLHLVIWPSLAGPADVHHSITNNNHPPPARLAHNISQIFEKDDRFTGKLREIFLDHFDRFDEAMRDNNVPHTLKQTIFRICLRMRQRYFYWKQVQLYNGDYEAAKIRMLRTYCNAARQNHVRQFRLIYSLQENKIKNFCDVSEELEMYRNIITKYAPTRSTFFSWLRSDNRIFSWCWLW